MKISPRMKGNITYTTVRSKTTLKTSEEDVDKTTLETSEDNVEKTSE
jgi:hypothetical protein